MDVELLATFRMVSLKFSTILFLNILIGFAAHGKTSPLRGGTSSTEESQISNRVISSRCRLVNTTLFAGNINWTRLTGQTVLAVINTSFDLQRCSGDCRLHNKRLSLEIKDKYALQMRNLVRSCKNKKHCDYLSPCCVPRRYHGHSFTKISFEMKNVTVKYHDDGAGWKQKDLIFPFLQPKDCHCQ